MITYCTKPSEKALAAEAALRAALEARGGARRGRQVVVAIGGDGTMLQATREHLREDVLFVGVSAGTLGFLQVVEIDRIDRLADALASGEYEVLEAPLLEVREAGVSGGTGSGAGRPGRLLGRAFNDVSLERAGARAAKFALKVGDSAGRFIGDGVIFATPLGSTAYSLAAAGPIIDTMAEDLFVVTPNNPHVSELYSSLQRPHVLHRRRKVRISIEPEDAEERPLRLLIDGDVVTSRLARPVEIGLSDERIKMIQLERDGFHNRIEAKRLGRS